MILAAILSPGLTAALAQSDPTFADQQASQAQQPGSTPGDPRLLLMIRNAIIALNQANLTGNYSVLRDMGTPNFQATNSSARLGDAFAALRARRIDISPIMFFTPKFAASPAMQDGQVLRAAGYFPTTPEQVYFDLAFQLLGEQWMLAAIAVNVAPPGENAQASAAPSSPSAEIEQKPSQIDLIQPAAATPAAAPKKPVARKPKPPAPRPATAQSGSATPTGEPQHAQPPRQPAPLLDEPPWASLGR